MAPKAIQEPLTTHSLNPPYFARTPTVTSQPLSLGALSADAESNEELSLWQTRNSQCHTVTQTVGVVAELSTLCIYYIHFRRL